MKQTKRLHLGRILLELDKDFTVAALRIIRQSGFPAVQASHVHLIAAIEDEGTPLAKVIERTNNSKQAVNKVLAQLEKMNLVERAIAKEDSRARIVQFTKAGKAFMKNALMAVSAVEKDYRDILGESAFELVRSKLLLLAERRGIF